MQKTPISIGIDLGHSSVKVSVKSANKIALIGATTIFPTVVRSWTKIANEETARKAMNDTVDVNGKRFFIGVTAQLQGQAENFSGQSRNWIETDQHDALLVGAWNRAQTILEQNNMADTDNISLVLGLPASYYAQQREPLRKRAYALISRLIPPTQKFRVFIESQSRAPLLCVAFDAYGSETGRAGEDESWGVIEIGHYTTDFTFHDRGQEVDGAASSASGAHMVYDILTAAFKAAGYLVDTDTITTAIKTRKVKSYGVEIDVGHLVDPAIQSFSSYIQEEVASRFGEKAQRMDGLIVAGGGAYMVGQDIRANYPNAVVPNNPRFAVAEGYSRFGLLTLQ
ncbi:ParM/StbA family protein [Rhodoferax antarcticus]|uniref:Uncharacterized protein n=1 Tax=Rhodoferax antarcticus ANT.BR TaxID=1111071 RepID=A0A1Q8Y9K8_9BURK|nr:ParM/StbA family protein [Rhodoferax antarcticus]OLP04560.1 hypothetical protein BLL52_4322 [Rhodoferax antarcticus ANT.BR]